MNASNQPLLEIEDLIAGYGQGWALRDLNATIEAGEMVGVLGPNGSGKSTLVRAITRMLPQISGETRLWGKPTSKLSRRRMARVFGVVPQDTNIAFAFSVKEIVNMGRTPYLSRFSGMGKRDMGVVEEAMRMTGVWQLRNRKSNQLSGGERQRVVLARALAQEPDLLLLDEPSSHLDINHKVELFDLLHKINIEEKRTVLLVSHDLNLTAEYCRRIILMDDGLIVADGTPQEVLQKDTLEKLYRTRVEVRSSPFSGAPQIWPMPHQHFKESSST
jgi:cobalamin transport system ATP-binding protein